MRDPAAPRTTEPRGRSSVAAWASASIRREAVEPRTVVERIRQDLLAEPVPQLELDTPLVITISAGVADFRASAESLRDAIAHADSALYEAKAHGRNRTIVARVAANG